MQKIVYRSRPAESVEVSAVAGCLSVISLKINPAHLAVEMELAIDQAREIAASLLEAVAKVESASVNG